MDVRQASDLTGDAFFDEYIAKGIPVIIKGDAATTEFVSKWNVDTLVEKCGGMKPNFGIRVLSFLAGAAFYSNTPQSTRLISSGF